MVGFGHNQSASIIGVFMIDDIAMKRHQATNMEADAKKLRREADELENLQIEQELKPGFIRWYLDRWDRFDTALVAVLIVLLACFYHR